MNDLVTFLTARLDEDAAEMHALATEFAVGEMILHSRSRRMRDIDAKRRIIAVLDDVAGYEDQIDGEWGDGHWAVDDPVRASVQILRLLALPYADHPDYDQAWRP